MTPSIQRGAIFVVLLALTVFLTWRLTRLTSQSRTEPPPDKPSLTNSEQATIRLFREASPSVVFITSLERRLDRMSMNVLEIPRGTGSGFVWDTSGHVVTNFHVIANAEAMSVTLWDHSTWPARPVGVAPDKDLAVLQIEAPAELLEPLVAGSSADLLVGQSVLAIGNPFGFDQTLTTGVISGLNREIESMTGRPISGVIQTDAAINPGNSGGPLLDTTGRLIGVNTAIYSPTGAYAGVGFAVPVGTIRRVVPQLIDHGRVIRPGLGIRVAEDHVLQRQGIEGVLIVAVAPGSAAAKAGLRGVRTNVMGRVQLGDVIVGVEDVPVRDRKDLYRTLDQRTVGDTVTLTLLRDGARRSVQVQLQAID